MRLHDPRRFGAMLWTAGDPLCHPRLRDLGPEPLSPAFDGSYLASRVSGRKAAIKSLIMDSRIVVGVGNIYATEALFLAGIHPGRAGGRIARARLDGLADAIKRVLAYAIERGGTTLRDFVNESGQPGYFAQELLVYGRAGEKCGRCGQTIRARPIGQRTSAFCPGCQR
jgi:formamidopyrimidine-DNA glycosylase